MPRLNDMEQKYIEKLIDFSYQHPDYGSAQDIWKAINQADPDQQRYIHTRWLLERTLSDNPKKCILWEDIAAGANSKAHDILKRFLTIRPLLPHDQRNLYRYGNLSDVTAVIRPLEHVKTPGEVKAEERERVDQETVVLYEQDGYKVLVPMSEEASCYWGRGTEWCTAATKSNNMFQSYHEIGPLVICILPDGKKVQFHENSDPMDENDEALEDITDPVLVQLCLFYGKIIPVNDELLDREMYLKFVKQNGDALEFVPDAFRNKEMCLEAVKKSGWALEYVPEPLCDKEMYLEAMKQDGSVLQFVPEELRDMEMCRESIKSYAGALEYVPIDIIDEEMYREAVKQNGLALYYVPEELRDKEMCMTAVKHSGWCLQNVPESLLDKEICLEAVKDEECLLPLVPEDFKREVIECLKEHETSDVKTMPEWIETSLLDDMTQHLQKTHLISTHLPKM